MNKDEKKDAKLKEKMAKEQEKLETKKQKEIIREEKERVRNSFWYKLKTFIYTIIFVAILLIVAFFGLRYYLGEKQKELYNEEMTYYYEQGKKLLEEKEYEKAIDMLNKVDKDSSIYKDAQTKLDETMEEYLAEYINTSNTYVESKDFDKAIEVFETLPEELRNSEKIQEAIANVEFAKIEEATKDITDSVEKLLEIKKNISDDLTEKALEKVNEYIGKTVDVYIEEIKKNISSRTYEKYWNELQKLINEYTDNAKINELKELIESYKPLSLLELEYQNDKSIIVSKKDDKKFAEDNKNTKYDEYILVNTTKNLKENNITWKLNKEYSELTGKICLNSKVNNTTSSGVKITILGDKKVIYKSKKIKKGTNSFDFNIDVTDVDELNIILESDEGISYFIGNPMINK